MFKVAKVRQIWSHWRQLSSAFTCDFTDIAIDAISIAKCQARIKTFLHFLALGLLY